MGTNTFRWVVIGAVFLSTMKVHAGYIGSGFQDLGVSTLDTNTNIEWLDLTVTNGFSFNEIVSDMSDEGGLFSLSDGWRYASSSDFASLINNWFGFNVGQNFTVLNNASNILPDERTVGFINLFGDTRREAFDLFNSPFTYAEDGAGGILGVLGDRLPSSNLVKYVASVYDGNLVTRFDGQSFSNSTNEVSSRSGAINVASSNFNTGHFLIRDFQPQVEQPSNVSEPQVIYLAGLVLFMLVMRNLVSKRHQGVPMISN